MGLTQTPRKFSIQLSLLAANVTLIGLALLLCALGIYFALYQPLLDAAAKSNMRGSADTVTAAIRTVFIRVEGITQSERAWGRRGLIDLNRPDTFDALLYPLISGSAGITSLAVASENGQEILFVSTPGNTWLNRFTDPDVQKGRAHFVTKDVSWNVVKDEWRNSDYDARQRPWFQAAMAMPPDAPTHWTKPFVYVSSGEPGVSAVLRWTGPDGRRYAMTNDLHLMVLTRVTQHIGVGTSGFAAVLSDDGKLLALPGVQGFAGPQAIQKALLKSVAAVGIAPLTGGFEAWNKRGRPSGELIAFDSGDTSWLASFQPVNLAGQSFWVATLAPASDFALMSRGAIGIGIGVVLASLILASLFALWLGTRMSAPIETLGRESARIGRMDLDGPITVTSPVRELDSLSRSLEQMRRSLIVAREESQHKAELELQMAQTSKIEALGKLAGGVAHDFGNLLGAISGFAELLAQDLPAEGEQHRFASRIISASQSGRALVRQILAFAQRTPPEERAVALRDVIKETVELLRAMLPRVAEIVTRNEAGNAVVLGDPSQLAQVLVNLCVNAADSFDGKQGQIAIALKETARKREDLRRLPTADKRPSPNAVTVWHDGDRTGHLTTGGMPSGPAVSLTVTDNGSGIPDDELETILEPYVTTKEEGKGTGIGLAVVHRIVLAMGGAMAVTTREGEGTTFEVVLPLVNAPALAGAGNP
jgi:signal transduction histidine kinase